MGREYSPKEENCLILLYYIHTTIYIIIYNTELDIEVDKLRSYLRLSANPELKYLSVDKYGNWAAMVDEIGRMVGGWIQSVSK